MSRSVYLSVLLVCPLWMTGAPALADVSAAYPPTLTLALAEQLARSSDPLASRFQRLAEAQRNQAVADGQLPDPKLKFGLANFPDDDFSRTKEPMTQLQLGVVQRFPPGETLAFQQRRRLKLSEVEQARSEEQALKAVRGTREAWLEVYFQTRAGEIIESSREFFSQLVDITQAQYGAGRANQQDVLGAALELSRLDDRQAKILTAEEAARAELGKWVGDSASLPLGAELPTLPALPTLGALEAEIPQHPSIGIQNAQLDASRLAFKVAREQYKPGWSVDLTYGQRGGNNADGNDRPDFVSAMVMMDLPLFTGKRQDRRVAASEQKILAATDARDERLRELRRMLHSDHARWRRLGERLLLYRERLVPEAKANVEAALLAYQSRVTEFVTLMRARISDLDIRLQALRLQVDRAKAQARLLYLAGGAS